VHVATRDSFRPHRLYRVLKDADLRSESGDAILLRARLAAAQLPVTYILLNPSTRF
jgi:hypothetical protein